MELLLLLLLLLLLRRRLLLLLLLLLLLRTLGLLQEDESDHCVYRGGRPCGCDD